MMLFLQEQDSLELMRVKLAVATIETYINITEPDQHRPEVDMALRRLWVRWDEINKQEAAMGVPECQEDEPREPRKCDIHDCWIVDFCYECRDTAEQRTYDDRKNVGRDL